MRRSAFGLAVLIAVLLVWVAPALAHASLERSDPPANAILMEPPEAIRLWFTEPLEPEFSMIRLLDASGNPVDLPSGEVDAADPRQLILHSGDLPDGVYTVDWRVLSAYDGHSTMGSFAFSIGVALDGAAETATSEAAIAPTNAAVRRINLISLALLFGSTGFWLLVWNACGFGPVRDAERRMKAVIWAGWLLVGLSNVLILLMQVSIAQNISLSSAATSPALPIVLTNTRFGHLWLARL